MGQCEPFANLRDFIDRHDGADGPHVTVFESLTGPLSKEFRFADGALKKETQAKLYRGRALRIAVPTIEALCDLLQLLRPNQALSYGVSTVPLAEIATTKMERFSDGRADLIARTRRHFQWAVGRGGFLMLDVDLPSDRKLTIEQFDEILLRATPELTNVKRAYRPSVSSHIYCAKSGELLSTSRNFRCYIQISEAAAVPVIGEIIYQRLWAIGEGHVKLSEGATLLDRSLVDAAVWRPEGLDFAGGAVLGEGLVQRLPGPVIYGEESELIVDDDLMKKHVPMRVWRQSCEALRKARAARKPERDALVETLVEERVKEVGGDPDDWRRAFDRHELGPDCVLLVQSKTDGGETRIEQVTVGQILTTPDKYNGCRCADPIEPQYRNDDRIAYVRLLSGRRPSIYSHAHGGIVYHLARKPERIEVRAGELPYVTDAVLSALRDQADLYECAEALVEVTGSRLRKVGHASLEDAAERLFCFERRNAKGQAIRTDAPAKLAQRLAERWQGAGFRRLALVREAPILRMDGTVLDMPGYDPRHEVLVCHPESSLGREWPSVPERPTRDEIRAAVRLLWKPFSRFPYETDCDCVAAMAAVLTATVRCTLPRAPAIHVDANAAGAGKTLLASCLDALAGGDGELSSWTPDTAEQEKRIASYLREGLPVWFYDNVREDIRSGPLEAALTAERISGRVLGETKTFRGPMRALVLLTTNNGEPQGDLWRRVLKVRMVTDDPVGRAFAFNPLEMVRARLGEIQVAALTLIRGYVVAGEPLHRKEGRARLSSFEQWDRFCVEPVLWAWRKGYLSALGGPTRSVARVFEVNPAFAAEFFDPKAADLGAIDPVKRIREAREDTEESMTTEELLGKIHAWKGSRWFGAKDLLDSSFGGEAQVAVYDALRSRGVTRDSECGYTLRKMVEAPGGAFTLKREKYGNNTRYRVVKRGG